MASPSTRRPPPRPPKSDQLLKEEAAIRASKMIAYRIALQPYPKEKNPFGESDEDEKLNITETLVVSRQSHAPVNNSPVNTDTNPFAFDCEESLDHQNEPNDDRNPETTSIHRNTPPTNPFDGGEEEQKKDKLQEEEVKENLRTTTVFSEYTDCEPMPSPGDEVKERQESPQRQSPPSPSKNPFADDSDTDDDKEEEDESLSRYICTGPHEINDCPQTPVARTRKRIAPKPPAVSSSVEVLQSPNSPRRHMGLLHSSMRLSLQAVNDSTARPISVSPMHARKVSTSCENVAMRVKGPAPSIPVFGRRDVRASSFMNYPKLRREIESVNAKLTEINNKVAEVRAKHTQSKWKNRPA